MHQKTIGKIIRTTEAMENFWHRPHGWAPAEAAALLTAARLDRQTSFTRTLHDYLTPFPPEQAQAKQILGYATLRSLCEGVLKLSLSVWLKSYSCDKNAVRDNRGQVVPPEKIRLDRSIVFYTRRVDAGHEEFLRRVQKRGNAIHHFRDNEIGTQDELIADIIHFWDFLLAVNDRLPYPDDFYNPRYA